MRILGVDPGSRKTGFGVIELQNRRLQYIASGVIRLTDKQLSLRLKVLHESLAQVVNDYKPDVLAIEQIFMHVNPNSALKLGHARGVAMAACLINGLDVFEYSARQIKLAVVGYGAADKTQVKHMVASLLHLDGIPQEDAADALACAMTYSQHHIYANK